MKGACAMIIALFVVIGSSVGDAQPRAPGRQVRLLSARPSIEQPRRMMSPAKARALAPRVFGARVNVRTRAAERDMYWIDEPEAKKSFRPRVVPKVMGFPTGGGGVGVKLRY
ncbi:MAG: hypothetical protein H0T42_04860 [Deltaproteobacteria bacterium]|nr:hypothetical protein [Deltaproteobacteria bacterium]